MIEDERCVLIISIAIYRSPSDERLLIDIFLFNKVRRSLALLVVFQARFNIRALCNLAVAGILFTVLPDILYPLIPDFLIFF